jgi:subtilase family serine protease
MQPFTKAQDRPFRPGFIGGGAIRRRLRTGTLGTLAWLALAPSALLAESKMTIPVSPMVERSNLVALPDAKKEISVILTLPLGDPQGAADFVQHVSTPGDPLFRKYITPEQFAARFGANANDYAALKEWATANGLRISQESSARTALTLRGTVAQFQDLFETKLGIYQSSDGKQFLSATTSPTIPDAVASKVSTVIGLTNSIQYAPLVKIAKTFGEDASTPSITTDTAGGTGPGGAYSAKDLRTAYGIPDFGAIKPQTVAVFEQGGFSRSDLTIYRDKMGLPHRPVKFVSVNGYNGEVNDPGVELEAVLDIDMVIGINPNVGQVLVYEDGSDSFQVAIIDALQQVASDNLAQFLSISYGLDEVQQPAGQMDAENTALTQLAAQGIGVLVSSGDRGAFGNTGMTQIPALLNVSDPASQPLVTGVGGTSLFTGYKEAYNVETVWNDLVSNIGNGGASGGGVSAYWALPSYQAPSYVTYNGGSATMRNVPDLGAVGDPNTGVAVYSLVNGGWVQVGGTSVSAPLWAGYISILNSGMEFLTGTSIGQINPFLYSVGGSFPGGCLYPVIDGSNGSAEYWGNPGYSAGYSYNNCTGSGTPAGGYFTFIVLTSQYGGTPPGDFNLTLKTLTATSATVTWTASSGANGYVIETGHDDDIPYGSSQAFITKERTFTLNKLTTGNIYWLAVTAVNSGGSNTYEVEFQPEP